MPFAGIAVNTSWAQRQQGHGREGRRVYTQSIALAVRSRRTATRRSQILMKVSKMKQDDVEKRLRFPDQGQVFRADRQDFQGAAQQAGRRAEVARRRAGGISRSSGCSCPASRRCPTDMWQSVRQSVSRRHAVGGRRPAAVGGGEPAVRRQSAVSGGAHRRSSQAVYALTLTGEMERHVAISAAEFAIGYVIASVHRRSRSASAWPTAPASSRRCSRGFPGSTRRRRSRSRRCSSCGSASASGRRCWW